MIRNIVKEIKAGLRDIYNGQLKGLYLYGSYSRNDADNESDIDILIVLENIESYSGEIGKTSNLVSELSLKYDVTISRVFVTQLDWAEKETPFLSNARKEAIAA
jgi:predicted nucleotidyltransferase